MSHEKYEEYQDCIAACHACVVACNHCAACCLQEADVKPMVRCIGLDMDCAQACQLAIAFMAGGSEHVAAACKLCAEICQAWATNARSMTWTTASNAPRPAGAAPKNAARLRPLPRPTRRGSAAPHRIGARLTSSCRNSASLALSRRWFTGPTRTRIFCPADSDSRSGSANSYRTHGRKRRDRSLHLGQLELHRVLDIRRGKQHVDHVDQPVVEVAIGEAQFLVGPLQQGVHPHIETDDANWIDLLDQQHQRCVSAAVVGADDRGTVKLVDRESVGRGMNGPEHGRCMRSSQVVYRSDQAARELVDLQEGGYGLRTEQIDQYPPDIAGGQPRGPWRLDRMPDRWLGRCSGFVVGDCSGLRHPRAGRFRSRPLQQAHAPQRQANSDGARHDQQNKRLIHPDHGQNLT